MTSLQRKWAFAAIAVVVVSGVAATLAWKARQGSTQPEPPRGNLTVTTLPATVPPPGRSTAYDIGADAPLAKGLADAMRLASAGRGTEALALIDALAADADARRGSAEADARAAEANPVVPAIAMYEMEPAADAASRMVDVGPSGAHGIVEGTGAFGDGHGGRGLRLNGEDTKALVPGDAAKLFDSIGRSLTITAWVKVDDLTSTAPIVSKRPGYGGPQPFAFAIEPEGRLSFFGYQGAAMYEFASPPAAAALDRGQWAHVGVSFAAREGLSFFVNGEVIGSVPKDRVPRELVPNDQPVIVGWDRRFVPKDQTMPLIGFRGMIDGLHFFAAALTPAQVKADMSGKLAVRKFTGDEKLSLARKQDAAKRLGRVVKAIRINVRRSVGQLSDDAWVTEWESMLAADPADAAEVVERVVHLSGEHLTAESLLRLMRGRLPAEATSQLAIFLAMSHAPSKEATGEQVAAFYQELIAVAAGDPVIAEGLLFQCVQRLDARGDSELTNRMLDGFTALFPDTPLGARTALLRVDGEPRERQDAKVLEVTDVYQGTAAARGLRFRAAQVHATRKRFLDALHALDVGGDLDRPLTKVQALKTMIDLIDGATNHPSLRPGRALAGAAPAEPLAGIGPLQFCIGVAEGLAGPNANLQAFRFTAGDTDTLPVDATPGSNKKLLQEVLQRAMIGTAVDQIQGALAASGVRSNAPVKMARAVGAGVKAGANDGRLDTARQFAQLTLQADMLKASRRPAEAAAIYRQIIDQLRDDPVAVSQSRRRLVRLLLEAEPTDLAAAHVQLAALAAESRHADDELWNDALRLLCRRTAAAPPGERGRLWSVEIAQLASGKARLAPEAMADLERLVAALGDGSAPTKLDALAVYTDVLTLVPDISSMRNLQARRQTILQSSGDAAQALSAAAVNLALASVTPDGPAGPARRYEDLLRSSGAPIEQVSQFQSQIRWGSRPQGDPAGGAGARRMFAGPDAPLVAAAAAALKADPAAATRLLPGSSDGARRRRAYLNLFAGRVDDALREAHAALDGAELGTEEVFACFDDLAGMLAIADGSLWNCNRFAQWMATKGEPATTLPAGAHGVDRAAHAGSIDPHLAVLLACDSARQRPASSASGPTSGPTPRRTFGSASPVERAELAKGALWRGGQRAVAWGLDLFNAGDVEWAATFWATAINTQRSPGYAGSLIDLLFEKTVVAHGEAASRSGISVLESVVASLSGGDRGRLQSQILLYRRRADLAQAKLLFEDGKFEECLSTLDQLDRALPESTGAEDLGTGFMRTLCLIRLARFDDAVSLLSRMEAWPGTDEQHAKRAFLVGWTYLQKEDKLKALPALRRVIERYPNTTFADKARKLTETAE